MLSRREFLASGLLAAASPLLAEERLLQTDSLALAPTTGLLENSAGTDVCHQLHAAADLGFSAFSEPDWLNFSAETAARFAETARQRDLRCGPARTFVPAASLHNLRAWEQQVGRQLSALQHGGVSGLRLELGGELQNALQESATARGAWLTSCRRLADLAAAANQTLLLEPLPRSTGSQDWIGPWLSVLEAARHPGWKMTCDTYLWGRAGFDWKLLDSSVAPFVGHVELADFPGGGPAGTGELPLAAVLAQLQRSGFAGIVALRHAPVSCGFTNNRTLVGLCSDLLNSVSRELQAAGSLGTA